jgi:hypothetical protein
VALGGFQSGCFRIEHDLSQAVPLLTLKVT